MSLVVPLNELVNELEATLLSLGALYMGLYDVNVAPSLTSTVSSFSPPGTGWMAPQVMSGRTAAAAASPVAFSNWNPVVFTNNTGSPVSIYGYFVTDSTSTTLWWAELNPAAPIVVPNGMSYTVQPYYSRGNQP